MEQQNTNTTKTQIEDAFEYAEKQLQKKEIDAEKEIIKKYIKRVSKNNHKLMLIATIIKKTGDLLRQGNNTKIPLIEIEKRIKGNRTTLRTIIEQLKTINIIKKENKIPPTNPNNKKSRKLRIVISLNTNNPNYVYFIREIKELINQKINTGEKQNE